MRKTKFKNRLWKTGILTFGILFTSTNCEKEELQTNSFEINNSLQYSLPSIAQVKQNFEYSVGENMSFYKKGILSKNIKNTIFIDWNNSKILKFKKQENIDILYTPVVFDKQNRRMKSFVGSITNDKNKIVSNLFALFYNESSTNEQFSGFISQSDINGNLLKIYKYVDGIKQMTYSVSKKNNNKSNTASKSDCEPTWQELLQIIDMMIQGGGGTYYSLECVTVQGLSDGSNDSGGGGGGLEPDSNLSGGYIPLGDSYYNLTPSGGTNTNTNPTSTITIEQWWNEEEVNNLSVESAVSMAIIEAIPTLTPIQKNWVNAPANLNSTLQLIDYLNANPYSSLAKDLVKSAIDILSSPELPSNNNVSNYTTEILRMTNYLKQWGNPEDEFFADYIESLVPDFSSMTVGDVYDIYKLTRTQVHNLTGKYFKSVIVPFAEAAFPFVVYAVTEATLGVATSLISKIPLNMVSRGARLNKMLIKLSKIGTPISGNEFFRKIPQSSVQKALKLFEKLTKNAISPPTTNAQGTIVANMGNNTYITFRTVSDTPGVIATIDINASSLFSQIIKLKFYQ